MRNRLSHIALLTVILMLTNIDQLDAQLMYNRLYLNAGYTNGSMHGDPFYVQDDFHHVAFYSNMTSIQGASLMMSYEFIGQLSVGAGIRFLKADNWEWKNEDIYTGSSANMFSFGPLFRHSTPRTKTGILSRIRLQATLRPFVGISGVKLGTPVTINNPIQFTLLDRSDLYSTRDPIWGIEGGIGVDYILTQDLGIFFQYTYASQQVKPVLYSDRSFIHSSFDLGVTFYFLREKEFLYK